MKCWDNSLVGAQHRSMSPGWPGMAWEVPGWEPEPVLARFSVQTVQYKCTDCTVPGMAWEVPGWELEPVLARFRCQQLPGGTHSVWLRNKETVASAAALKSLFFGAAGRYRYNTITPIPVYKILLAPDRQDSTSGSLLRKLTLVGVEDGHLVIKLSMDLPACWVDTWVAVTTVHLAQGCWGSCPCSAQPRCLLLSPWEKKAMNGELGRSWGLPLIGREWSRDPDTGLWLAESPAGAGGCLVPYVIGIDSNWSFSLIQLK